MSVQSALTSANAMMLLTCCRESIDTASRSSTEYSDMPGEQCLCRDGLVVHVKRSKDVKLLLRRHAR